MTKDPEYLKLLTPPLDNDFLQAYSQGYREKSAEIEARIADIGDENLRSQARNNEWARVPKKERDRFKDEADVTFNEAKISFSQKHQDGLFEVGHVSYDETNSTLVVKEDPTAPIEGNFRMVISSATINQVYDRFRQVVAQDIERKARDYVSKAGAGSICARNPDWCYNFSKEDIERNLRSARIVVVAQGDLKDRRIDHLFLVDYDTEAVLLELDPHISTLNNAAWRFSIGLPPTTSTELQSSETQDQPAAVASSESGFPPNQQAEGTGTEGIGEAASNKPISSDSPPTRMHVLGNLTAADMIVHTTPEYPPQARARHIQGDVVLHAIIDKEGNISEVQVLSGDDLLAPSALEAVRQWRYKPILFDGEPMEVDSTITVTFSLLD